MTEEADMIKNPRKQRSRLLLVFSCVLMLAGFASLGAVVYDWTSPSDDTELADSAQEIQDSWSQDDSDVDAEEALIEHDDAEEAKEEEDTNDEDSEESDEPTSPPYEIGEEVGVIKIPAFGEEYAVPIVYGVSDDELDQGVGMYPDFAMPGDEGNFGLAGHRTGENSTFYSLPELSEGDEIIIETEDHIYTYVTTKEATETEVDKSETWVLDDPDIPDDVEESITLTTCASLYPGQPERFALFGELDSVEER